MKKNNFMHRVRVCRLNSGSYRVCITYRGRQYECWSNNSLAYDMLYWEKGEPRNYYRSARQAWLALYNECKQKNGLP